jgi:hypothetical protein
MEGQLKAEEHNKIKTIEQLTCNLANTVGSALGRAKSINRFFFGVPEDSVEAKPSEKTVKLTGWFESHMVVLRHIDEKVQDIYNALGNIHEVVEKK